MNQDQQLRDVAIEAEKRLISCLNELRGASSPQIRLRLQETVAKTLRELSAALAQPAADDKPVDSGGRAELAAKLLGAANGEFIPRTELCHQAAAALLATDDKAGGELVGTLNYWEFKFETPGLSPQRNHEVVWNTENLPLGKYNLYTRPQPQSDQPAERVALKPDQIQRIAEETDILYVASGEGDYGSNLDSIIPFARAIEAALLEAPTQREQPAADDKPVESGKRAELVTKLMNYWLNGVPPESRDVLRQAAAALLAADDKAGGEVVKFLCNGTRFKMEFFDDGDDEDYGGTIHVKCFNNFEKELGGRWVALVAADDDCHLKLTTPPTPPAGVPDGFVLVPVDILAASLREDAGHEICTNHAPRGGESHDCTGCGARNINGWHEPIKHKPGCSFVAKEIADDKLRAVLSAAPQPEDIPAIFNEQAS